jgi:hypothetical protein
MNMRGLEMKKRILRKPWWLLFFVFGAIGLTLSGCQKESKKVKIHQSKQVQRDFYTCKGFDASGIPVSVTSEFHVDDNLIYVIANLEKEQLGNRLNFEISSPDSYITFTENVEYVENRPYGFFFDTHKLYERGGGGKWRVLFWADGEPMGRVFFNLSGPDDEYRRSLRDSSGNVFESIFGQSAAPQYPQEERVADVTAEVTDEPVEEEFLITPDMDTAIDAQQTEPVSE